MLREETERTRSKKNRRERENQACLHKKGYIREGCISQPVCGVNVGHAAHDTLTHSHSTAQPVPQQPLHLHLQTDHSTLTHTLFLRQLLCICVKYNTIIHFTIQ